MVVVAIAFPPGLEQLAVTVTLSGAFPLVGETCSEQAGGRGGVTVRVVELLMFPEAAVICVAPVPIALAKPLPLIEATDDMLEDHETESVKFCLLPSV